MKHRYLPMTEQDRHEMMEAVGIQSMEELFSDIPEAVRYQGTMPMSEALDEYALLRHMKELADKNANFDTHASFLGSQTSMTIISRSLSIMSSPVRNSTLLILLTSRKSAKASCRRSLNSSPTFVS